MGWTTSIADAVEVQVMERSNFAKRHFWNFEGFKSGHRWCLWHWHISRWFAVEDDLVVVYSSGLF